MRILLADDHHFVREAIANYLSRVAKDIVCSEVADLLQAKEKLAVDAAFCLIMLDYQMPGMNEVTVTVHLIGITVKLRNYAKLR